MVHTRTSSLRAFTLIELLVTISIIGILASLTLASLSKSKESVRKTACINNLKQLGLATLMYASDDANHSYSAKLTSIDQRLSWLLPYLDQPKVLICPGTRNFIREQTEMHWITGEIGLVDTFDHAPDRGHHPGMSYVGFGFSGVNVDRFERIPFLGSTIEINGIRKTEQNVQNYVKYHDSFNLKGTVVGPSRMWIIADNTMADRPFFPDADDNHGEQGSSVLFCDGHVEHIKSKDYVYKYELSQDEGRVGIEMPW